MTARHDAGLLPFRSSANVDERNAYCDKPVKFSVVDVNHRSLNISADKKTAEQS